MRLMRKPGSPIDESVASGSKPAPVARASRPTLWQASLGAAMVLFLALLPATVRGVFWQGLKTHGDLAIMVLVFSLVALSLLWSAGQRLDAWAFLLFNLRGSRPLWLDRTMLGFTQLGNGIAGVLIALAFFLANDRLLAYEIVLGILSLWLVVELTKSLLHRRRPYVRLTQARVVGHRHTGRSFPSGHTSQVFFMVTLIAQHFHAAIWASLPLYAIALLLGVTRMYVGAHYPRDVLAGAILGSAWGLLGAIVDPYVFIGIS
jgi:membrane-associated phospholipid phosphatase